MASTIKLKSGKKNSWSSKNPRLATGELGLEYDENSSIAPRLKAGYTSTSGLGTPWSALPYLTPNPRVYKELGEIAYKQTIAGISGTAGIYFDMNKYPTTKSFSGVTSAIMYASTNTAKNGEIAQVSVTLKGPVALKGASPSIYLQDMYPVFLPDVNTDGITGSWESTPDKIWLGWSGNEWAGVYAKSGTIQTSDRSAKSDIHYIDYQNTSSMKKSRAVNASTKLSLESLVEGVKALKPATFCYGEDVTEDTVGIPSADIQIGFIADDMLDNPLFKYVGVEDTVKHVITPAVEDESGEIITPEVSEPVIKRGLQPLPLAAVALSTCKYLINKIETLESEIETLKTNI